MIVSASYRTDIPAFYGDWFRRRLAAGSCRVANPYGGPPATVSLTPETVDGFVFWTRNAAPFAGALADVAGRAIPFVVHYTITGYPRPLEPSVTSAKQSIETLRALAKLYGPRVCVWRYDPVLLTSLTPPAWHRETFARLAAGLTGAVDEVVLSFAHIYAKTARNTARAAARYDFTWEDPPVAIKRDLLADLAAIAADHGLKATLCAQPELLGPELLGPELLGPELLGPELLGPDLETSGIAPARCIDAVRLADVAHQNRAARPIAARAIRTKGNRPGCLCAESRDIGAYDSCPHGCVYCYAVRTPEAAKRTYRMHDPAGAAIDLPRVRNADKKFREPR
jgi:Domain of unknown function (DUF1848)